MESRNLGAVAKRSRLIPMPDGSTLEVQPLHLGDWATLEEEAVQAAKRDLLETYTKNMDLLAMLPEPMREKMLLDVFKRAEDLRADNLPTVTVKVKADGKEVEVAVGYAHWWVSRTMKGKMTAAWLGMRKAKPGLTYEGAGKLMADWGGEAQLETVANAVGEISKPTLGNGEAPQDGALV
jgi:hypothetical protein